ncbi:O-antigen ligase family protein, partial [Halorubrum ejinorense]
LSSITAGPYVPESALRAIVAIIVSGTGIFIIPEIYSRRSFFWHILLISFALGLLSILAVITPFESVGSIELLRTVPYDQFVVFGPQKYAPVPVGGLGNPNILAMTLLPGILAGANFLYERAAEHSTWGVFSFGVVTAVPTIILFLTRSRGALLALAAGVVMYVVVHNLSSVTVRILCLCGITGTVLFLAPTGIGPIPSLVEAVSAPRAFRWRHALDAILQQPLLGYGVGNSRTIIPEFQTQPHNAYFMIGTWSGVGAAISYLYLFTQMLLLSVRRKVGTTPAVFPAILTSYWVISIFESLTIFHLTIYSIVLAITFGFVASDIVPHERATTSNSN